ncbi:putative pectinesterase/pectinesterase inhibitor 51, partial [Bienertia sinuspersici]
MGQSMVQKILDDSAHNPTAHVPLKRVLRFWEILMFGPPLLRVLSHVGSLGTHVHGLVLRFATSMTVGQVRTTLQLLKYVNDSAEVNSTMSYFDTVLIASTSNALSMLRALDALGPNPASWARPAQSGMDSGSPLLPVWRITSRRQMQRCAKEEGVHTGRCRMRWIRPREFRRRKEEFGVLGDGIGKTVITGSLSTGINGITTYNTATVESRCHQAVAFRSDSDFSYIENCEFLGNQDTVYVHALRQFFKSCRIEGN